MSPDWMRTFLSKLLPVFGSRLLYLGLQGSRRRGEATAESDIDVVAVLDSVSPADLDAYREVVRAMPEGEKACGFISGAGELAAWPRHELFQFRMDTEDYHGTLDDFLPSLTRDDLREGVRAGAAGLYHLLAHTRLYAGEEERRAALEGAFKAAFFVLLVKKYLASGVYAAGKRQLLERLAGEEKEILAAGLDFREWLGAHGEGRAFSLLFQWVGGVLRDADTPEGAGRNGGEGAPG